MSPVLAEISGHTLLAAFVWIVIAGVIFWILNWSLAYIGVPEPFAKVLKVVIVLIALIMLINGLLMLAGRPLFSW